MPESVLYTAGAVLLMAWVYLAYAKSARRFVKSPLIRYALCWLCLWGVMLAMTMMPYRVEQSMWPVVVFMVAMTAVALIDCWRVKHCLWCYQSCGVLLHGPNRQFCASCGNRLGNSLADKQATGA